MLSYFLVYKKYISRGSAIREKKNGRVGKFRTTAKVAAAAETSTRIEAMARLFPQSYTVFSKKNLSNGRFINILSSNLYPLNEGKKLTIPGKVIISTKTNN